MGAGFFEEPEHCVVRLRAFELWIERGCPLWEDEIDWFNAEREIEEQKKSGENITRLFTEWRASYLWQICGRPVGRDEEFWYRAECDIIEAVTVRIKCKAYELWEKRGGEDGDNWNEAKRQLGI